MILITIHIFQDIATNWKNKCKNEHNKLKEYMKKFYHQTYGFFNIISA